MWKLAEYAVGGSMAWMAVSGADELIQPFLREIERAMSMGVGF